MIANTPQLDIRIGTLVPCTHAPEYIAQILPHGFESFSITFGYDDVDMDLKDLALRVKKVLEGTGVIISSLGVFGNARHRDRFLDAGPDLHPQDRLEDR